MWLFTKHGFYSVVKSQSIYMIRGRRKGHMVNLKERCNLQGPIVETNNTDYRYRYIATEKEWQAVMRALTHDVDYPNFKAACETIPQQQLHHVWAVMR